MFCGRLSLREATKNAFHLWTGISKRTQWCSVFPSSATNYSWPREWNIPETSYRQVSWLIDPHTNAAFPIAQWHNGILLPVYSDEFVRDSHPFPFSPRRLTAARHLQPASCKAMNVIYHILRQKAICCAQKAGPANAWPISFWRIKRILLKNFFIYIYRKIDL